MDGRIERLEDEASDRRIPWSMLLTFLIVGTVLSWLGTIFIEASTRSSISRPRSDLRSLGTALESYREEWGKYPVPSEDQYYVGGVSASQEFVDMFGEVSENGRRWEFVGALLIGFGLAAFLCGIIQLLKRLFNQRATSWRPVLIWFSIGVWCFVIVCWGNFNDSRRPRKRVSYGYYVSQSDSEWNWILLSPGPDLRRDLPDLSIMEGKGAEIESALIPYRYDPTNGTFSSGDILRVGLPRREGSP